MVFLNHVQNRATLRLSSTEHFAAIIGAAPSKGARSPTLWNRAFQALKLSGMMHPFDVAPDGLRPLLEGLRAEPRFMGGAVAVPYKQEIVPYLDDIESEARAIGAVNAIHRRDGQLVGTNTDGAAALASAWKLVPDLAGRNVLLMGVGGAGRAVAAYLARALGRAGRLSISNRTANTGVFAEKLAPFCRVEICASPPERWNLQEADLIVNCTSIGSELVKPDGASATCLLGFTPLAPIGDLAKVSLGDDFVKRFCDANHDAIRRNLDASWTALGEASRAAVYDIVYQPTQSILLTLARSRGLRTLGGEQMNLDQAVIAFAKAVESFAPDVVDLKFIRQAMSAPAAEA